jgi:hypothetical protein
MQEEGAPRGDGEKNWLHSGGVVARKGWDEDDHDDGTAVDLKRSKDDDDDAS